jgi:hypothetical protein
MPLYFFGGFGGGGTRLDYETAVKADIANQNYTVAPRHWYIDATMRCTDCDETFVFSASEQRVWYEEFCFYVDSYPKRCPRCRAALRNLKSLRQEYDARIAEAVESKDVELKSRLITIIDSLCEASADLPEKVHENRNILARQMARLQS